MHKMGRVNIMCKFQTSIIFTGFPNQMTLRGTLPTLMSLWGMQNLQMVTKVGSDIEIGENVDGHRSLECDGFHN